MSGGNEDVWLLDPGEMAGGGQRFGLRLAQALQWAGHNVTVCCRGDGPLAVKARDGYIAVRDMRFPALVPWNPAVPRAVLLMRRFLAGLGPDALVIGNHPRAHAYLFAAAPRSGGAVIVNLAHEQESAGRGLARFAYRRIGSLAVVGSNTAAAYEARLPGVTVTKLNNFLPPEYFDRAAAARTPKGEDGARTLGVLARLIPEKGIAELVDELASPAVGPLWSEALVGGPSQDASYTARVKARIAEHGLGDRVRLVGDVEDVPGFLAGVDALLVPSTGHEAQPTVIVEALAHGVPVIVREPVFSADFDGLPVVPYRDADGLAAALGALPPEPAPAGELIRRFGPGQAVAAIEAAAQLARARS